MDLYNIYELNNKEEEKKVKHFDDKSVQLTQVKCVGSKNKVSHISQTTSTKIGN
jgi:hypothetical protein